MAPCDAQAEIRRLSERVRELEEALSKYANLGMWAGSMWLAGDPCEIARAALAQPQAEQKPVCNEFGGLDRCCTYPHCYCGRKDEPWSDKGHKSGECNRTACNQRPATWWNPNTRAFYCAECAQKINSFCPADMPQWRLTEQQP